MGTAAAAQVAGRPPRRQSPVYLASADLIRHLQIPILPNSSHPPVARPGERRADYLICAQSGRESIISWVNQAGRRAFSSRLLHHSA
jgi:hypothetical protein